MKLLHIGLCVNRDKNIGLSKAFRNRCEKYEEFPISAELPNQVKSIDFKPDIVFCQIQSEELAKGVRTNDRLGGVMNSLMLGGAFILNWTGDIRNRIPDWMRWFPCDVTCFSNMRDVNDFTKESEFLQIGIDPETFKLGYPHVNVPDIVYMANRNPQFPLAGKRSQLVRRLQDHYGSNFGLYGIGYPNPIDNLNADGRNPHANQSREAQVYNHTKIAISLSNYKVERYTSDRLLRCMGSGACTISHHYPGIEQDFKVGEHLETFHHLDDLIVKIDQLLADPKRRTEIALNGYKHIHENFTYHSMVQNIFDIYEARK